MARLNRLLAALLLSALGTTVQAQWVSDSWDVMGTRAQVEIWAPDPGGAAAVGAVRDEFERLNTLLSPWIEDSVISRINRLASSEPVHVSEEVAALLNTSRHYNILTDGAFDITFASAGHLYDYRQQVMPDADALAQARSQIGMQSLSLSPENAVVFSKPGMKIDLGGIAKGYAIDRAVAILRDLGIQHAWISLGGDSYTLGDRRGRPWMVGIRHPRNQTEIVLSIPVNDLAVSTSGDYERFFIKDGERIHHIINPVSGEPAGQVVSVTILASASIDADALSTSVFVMGIERGMKLVESLDDVSAVIIDQSGKVFYSSDLTGSD